MFSFFLSLSLSLSLSHSLFLKVTGHACTVERRIIQFFALQVKRVFLRTGLEADYLGLTAL